MSMLYDRISHVMFASSTVQDSMQVPCKTRPGELPGTLLTLQVAMQDTTRKSIIILKIIQITYKYNVKK